MKVLYKLILIILPVMLILSGCTLEEPDIKKSPDVQLSNTTTTLFSRYVAVGNSLTAGFQSAALTERDQKHSYVKKIAEQAGVGDQFVQPLLGWPGIGSYTMQGAGILSLNGFDASGSPIIQPVPYAGTGFNPANPYLSDAIRTHPAPYNNLGVPALVLADMDSAISSTQSYSHSPFFDIILRNANPAFGNSNPIEQALMLQPTFITCWVGNNDVLGYATSGGTNPASPTPTATFELLYGNLLNKLTSGGASVVVANIPDVTSIPFFTTVPSQVEVQGQAVSIVIQTASGVRTATSADLLTLSAKAVIGDVSGTYGPAGVPVGLNANAPLPSSLVLDEAEAAIAQTAVENFNAIIAQVAASMNVPVVDINAVLADASNEHGYPLAGVELSTSFISGGLISLDGVHPTSLGAALIANEWIATINANFMTNIPMINLLEFLDSQQPLQLNKAPIAAQTDMFMKVPALFGGKIEF